MHIGCNTGSTTKLLDLYVDGVVGLDIQENAISVARHMYPDIQFDVGNILHLPYADETFGGIYLLDVLEHIWEEDVDTVLSEMHRVLKPNSHLFVFMPTGDVEFDDEHHVFYLKEFHEARNLFEKYFQVVTLKKDLRSNPNQKIAPGSHNHWSILCRKS